MTAHEIVLIKSLRAQVNTPENPDGSFNGAALLNIFTGRGAALYDLKKLLKSCDHKDPKGELSVKEGSLESSMFATSWQCGICDKYFNDY